MNFQALCTAVLPPWPEKLDRIAPFLESVHASEVKSIDQLPSMTHYYLPHIQSSLKAKSYPRHKEVCRAIDNWCAEVRRPKHQAEQQMIPQCKISLLNCMFMPEATQHKEMLAACKFLWCTGMLDDPIDDAFAVDEKAARNWKDIMLRAATGNATRTDLDFHPTVSVYADVLGELRSLMSRSMFQRLIDCQKDYSEGCLEEVRGRLTHDQVQVQVPSVQQYLEYRRQSVFAAPTFITTELVMGLDLDEEFLSWPEFDQVRVKIINHIMMLNDLLSMRVDMLTGHFLTLPGILLCTDVNVHNFQEAINKSSDLVQETEAEMHRLHQILMRKAMKSRPQYLDYIRAMPHVLSANYIFSYTSARYHGINNPFITGMPFSGTCLVHPLMTVLLPELKPESYEDL